MRLFTAIELPDDARTAIAAVQTAVASGPGGASRALRLVRAEHVHLTLVFIGAVPEVRAAPIIEAMSADIAQAPFRIVFGGVGVFPPDGAPRVLWLGVLDGARAAIDLQARVAGRLRDAGLDVEQRPYRPHLTLARWRDARPRERLAPTASPGAVAAVDVSAVALLQSRLSSAGPSYTRLAQARLVCP